MPFNSRHKIWRLAGQFLEFVLTSEVFVTEIRQNTDTKHFVTFENSVKSLLPAINRLNPVVR